ncbi:brassinosteroid-responsive RING protein 1-like [Humulus lupulus]|uniref:brassinosteroid-responsive RING protein 1-like n=1 Tax=Humulus lupulus TaxID=3486 RepID=UPI002B40FCCB|nr:brassinosteroid-responsive RING protein 1-like [Humulus lupulus]
MIFSQQHTSIDHDDDHDRPPPSLVAVPAVFFMAESIKKQLPAMPYSSLVEKSSTRSSSCLTSCIVCMNEIECKEEVRVPINCRHVFHKECLDAWIDQGQPSCPLCRSKLLPSSENHQDEDQDGHDPWRKERMLYLFGDDYLFEQHN